MIALYIVAIVVVCGLVVFYFCWTVRRRKRALEQLNEKKEKKPKKSKKAEKATAEKELKEDLVAVEEEVVKEEKKIEAELVDFSLDDIPKPAESVADDAHHFNGGGEQFDAGIDESLFESKMEDYERFLKEEQENYLASDEEHLSEEDQNDIDALMSFDFDSLKGKSRQEVSEMIKDLSPAVQDFILNDILERKNSED